MRSILLTLDETPSGATAKRIALGLARQTGAAIKGISGVDVSDLEGGELAPLGAQNYAHDRRQRRAKLALERRARAAALPASFEQSCAAAGVEANCHMLGEDIRSDVLCAMETCDLVVTGQDAEFHLEPLDEVSPLVEHIVARGCRPVLVTGPEAFEEGPVIVAYDGSLAAAKALQLAVLLGIFGTSSARVVSVSPGDEAFQAATRARDFLLLHGITTDMEAITSTDHPADVLCARAAAVQARMLVMGAFGHRGLHEMLFGSSTRRLLRGLTVPLFIYH
ncbi:universal stress protein [Reyranella sp.]|uniref:universal stress protein n=1 Tax=Reyranella sp. TaxID=1929291 RepID=UPI003D116898